MEERNSQRLQKGDFRGTKMMFSIATVTYVRACLDIYIKKCKKHLLVLQLYVLGDILPEKHHRY